ncbi:MAG: hypothetical protein JW967_03160 [Dehalococcoidales bacterium]|nr:hypothetical protein [Dehalococcoidales bacterium]
MQDDRNLESTYHSAVSGLYARIRSYYDYLTRKYGDEGITMISEMSREYGTSIAARAKKKLDNNDIISIAQYLIRIFNTVGWGRNLTELIESGPDKIVIKANECPLHFDNPAMCVAHTTMEKTVVETLNPELTYIIGKSIPAGDKFCEHIITVNPVRK